MASQTTNLHLRKPDPSDTVDVAADINASMDILDAAVAGKAASTHTHGESDITNLTADLATKVSSAAYSTYVPILTASVSNPSLGSTGSANGRFVQIGKTVRAEVSIIFGGTGIVAGSGIETVTLPVPAVAPLRVNMPIGVGHVLSSVASQILVLHVNTTQVQFQITYTAGAAALTSTAWVAGWELYFTCTYQAA